MSIQEQASSQNLKSLTQETKNWCNNPLWFGRYSFYNLFTTSDSPNIRIPILQFFVFVIEGGQENIFLLVENMFSCPPSITKTIFGESDVVNKLLLPVIKPEKNGDNFETNV